MTGPGKRLHAILGVLAVCPPSPHLRVRAEHTPSVWPGHWTAWRVPRRLAARDTDAGAQGTSVSASGAPAGTLSGDGFLFRWAEFSPSFWKRADVRAGASESHPEADKGPHCLGTRGCLPLPPGRSFSNPRPRHGVEGAPTVWSPPPSILRNSHTAASDFCQRSEGKLYQHAPRAVSRAREGGPHRSQG